MERFAFSVLAGWLVFASGADRPTSELSTLLAGVNQARVRGRDCGSAGNFPAAAPLIWNNLLAQAAQRQSHDMAANGFSGHTGSDGSSLADRVTATGYSWTAIGETIAAGYDNADAVLQAWLRSPGHCANLMNPSFQEMGAGKAVNQSSAYGTYWTQVFGAPR
jgi:uncharacterized protein YkwD